MHRTNKYWIAQQRSTAHAEMATSTGGKKYVLGVDGGTGGIRAGLFDIATGTPVGFADTPYVTEYPHPGWAEQAPADWWSGFGASVKKVLADTGVAPGMAWHTK
jgi:sugar (pentulose or hexulose) kinase